MAETYDKLAQGRITVTTDPPPSGHIYESAGVTTIIKHIRVASVAGSGNRVFKLYHTDGAVPTVDNLITPAMTVEDGGFAEFEGTITMGPSDRIYAYADVTNTLVITLYGMTK